MTFDNKEEWLKEYTEYTNINVGDREPPASLLSNLKRKLFPSPWLVFSKIVGIHLVVGYLSLAICNQFGLNPFQTDQFITTWFMKVAGHNLCMLLCGVFFIATTYMLANLFLSLEELEAIKKYEWLQTGVISLVSLFAFYFFGAELAGGLALLWTIGAMMGGYVSIEGSYWFRKALA